MRWRQAPYVLALTWLACSFCSWHVRKARPRGPAARRAVVPWSAGPAKLETAAARRVQKQLQYDPLLVLVDEMVKEEFKLLAAQKAKQERARLSSPPGAFGEALSLLSLRRRMAEIKRKERLKTASELVYLMVGSMFKYLEVPFIPPLRGGGKVKLDMKDEQLRGLTEIYSMEALELVRDHLFHMVGIEAQRSKSRSELRIATYQAGQVYAMSALFGYYLRRADVRYQLDKLVSMHTDAPQEKPMGETRKRHRRPVPRWMELCWAKGESRGEVPLKAYIRNFGPAELREMRRWASMEAKTAMEMQVSALFGNLVVLKSKLVKAVEAASDEKEATELLEAGLDSGAVESLRISYENLRRLILEAVAFGSVLFDAEREAYGLYELTPTDRKEL